MAPTYTSGRRGPNVSQYLRQLNTVPEKPLEDDFTFEDDLAMFTNTHFYDFETGQHMDYQAPPAKPDCEPSTATTVSPDDLTSSLGDLSNLDFISGDFNFTDFNSYPSSGVPTFHEGLGNVQPLQPTPQTHYSTPVAPHPHPQPATYVQPVSRPSEPVNRPISNFEEQSRLAADEDKRRRNTAASARFRIKKKQREQALEKTAKEMSDKVAQLESRINLLETENRWLKNLVMEKNDGNEEIAAMFKEFDSKHKANKTIGEAASSDVKGEK
ncbi:hypothetical protein ACRALDRAFT_1060354 [Sodiomyces alcalophilus JCM 7366]|uniref:uncharacterized protein n=1 Tax=Sodiomyces alcalophilus JCM 7366 TaxID=591952 RepID=UPI0039B5B742